jgi:hypothetical protein
LEPQRKNPKDHHSPKNHQETVDKFKWDFNTFGDDDLEYMFTKVKQYCVRVLNGEKIWLTMSGPTEIGKTHLLNKVDDFFREYKIGRDYFDQEKARGNKPYKHLYDNLYSLVTDSLSDPQTLKRIKCSGTLAIEEVFSWKRENNFTDIQIDIAFQILNHRINNEAITIMDTNRSIQDLERIDERIASRMFRNSGVFIEMPPGTKGYLTRKQDHEPC